MATQTRFNLNAAVENWRNELAAQPQLAPDDRRELEKHLTDAMADLRGRGLNDEESFWLASRRIGRPQQLAEEFHKADPAGVWRERVFWMALAFLFFMMWESLLSIIPYHNGQISYICLIYLAPICVAVLLAKGKLTMNYPALKGIFKKPWLFVGSAIIFLLSTHGLQVWESYKFIVEYQSGRQIFPPIFWVNQIQSIGFPLMTVALAAWLLPARERKISKPA